MYLFTLQNIDTVKNCVGGRFMYNESIYNLSILNNYVNLLFDKKLKTLNFFKKKNTMPITGFVLDEKKSINLSSRLNRDITKVRDVMLVIYKIDNIDKFLVCNKSINNLLIQVDDKNDRRGVVNINEIKLTKKKINIFKRINNGDYFTTFNDVTSNLVFAPRLRTKNIVGCIDTIMIQDKLYNRKYNTNELYDMIINSDSYTCFEKFNRL